MNIGTPPGIVFNDTGTASLTIIVNTTYPKFQFSVKSTTSISPILATHKATLSYTFQGTSAAGYKPSSALISLVSPAIPKITFKMTV